MSDIYILDKSKKIKILIFNHTEFSDNRLNSRSAEIGIKFEKFFKENYGKFVDISMLENFKKTKVIKILKEVSENGSKFSALIVCVSSHGGQHEIKRHKNGLLSCFSIFGGSRDDEHEVFYETIYANDVPFHKTDLWRPFKDNKSWEGKPKLFFIQACRGEDDTGGAPIAVEAAVRRAVYSHDARSLDPEPEPEPIFTELKFPDLFIMNATQQSTLSWKRGDECHFIDALIHIFREKKGYKCDLLSMAVEISNHVAIKCEIHQNSSKKHAFCQQMPTFETMLTKKFYFPNAEESFENSFYEVREKPLAIVLNYSYKDTVFPDNTQRAKANESAINKGLSSAGFECSTYSDLSKKSLSKLLKDINNSKRMILIFFNGYGERDELYLNKERIKVYQLWKPLLPKIKAGEKSSGIPKICLISAPNPDPTKEGVSGKIRKLCKAPTHRNVKHCEDHLGENYVNIPTTADLLILYETAAAKTNLKDPNFEGSAFVKYFSDELMNTENDDIFAVFRNVLHKYSTLENRSSEVPLAFSTLRKLVPVCRNYSFPIHENGSGESTRL